MMLTLGIDLSQVRHKLVEFDLEMMEYEGVSSDIISDEMIRGILVHAAPEPMRTHLPI